MSPKRELQSSGLKEKFVKCGQNIFGKHCLHLRKFHAVVGYSGDMLAHIDLGLPSNSGHILQIKVLNTHDYAHLLKTYLLW